MKLFVRTPWQKDYHRQLNNYPAIPTFGIKPGDTLYSLRANYHINKVEYDQSELTVYATKTQIF